MSQHTELGIQRCFNGVHEEGRHSMNSKQYGSGPSKTSAVTTGVDSSVWMRKSLMVLPTDEGGGSISPRAERVRDPFPQGLRGRGIHFPC